MVAISIKSHHIKRKRKLLVVTLKEAACEIENTDDSYESESSIFCKSKESGFYDDPADEKNISEEEDLSDVNRCDSLLQNPEEGSRSRSFSQETDVDDDEVINDIICEVHHFDEIIKNPVEDFDTTSSEDEDEDTDDSDLDLLGENLTELLSNPADVDVDADDGDSADSNSALRESNYKFREENDLNQHEIQEKVERAVASNHSLVSIEVEETGDMMALTSPDTRPSTFHHQVDRETFNKKMETLAEVNKFKLAGWTGTESYGGLKKVRRGGLRYCFSEDMVQFKEVHKESVRKLFDSQAAEVERSPVQMSSLTPRNPPKPKLPHYIDFIQRGPKRFKPAVVDQLLKSLLSKPPGFKERKMRGRKTNFIDEDTEEEEEAEDGSDTETLTNTDAEKSPSRSSIDENVPAKSSSSVVLFDENLSMPTFDD